MKTAELTGAQLDAWVAKAEGVTGLVEKDGRMCHVKEWDPEGFAWRDDMRAWVMWCDYAPSQRWDHGGTLIERERINIMWDGGGAGEWYAEHIEQVPNGVHGATPLIAAMRAYVASKFGEEVPDKTE
jgi:hypothetical protein